MFREVLNGDSWHVLVGLAGSSLADEFYLAGDTGLALQLRHRRSFDLGFFTKTPAE